MGDGIDFRTKLAKDLARVMDLVAAPYFVRVLRHPRGIPQYTLGHPDRLERIENQLDALERSLRHLTEVVQFDRQLKPAPGARSRPDAEPP